MRPTSPFLLLLIVSCHPQSPTPVLQFAAPPARETGRTGNEVDRGLLGCYALYDRHGDLLDDSYYNASSIVRLDSLPTAREEIGWIGYELYDTTEAHRRSDSAGLMIPLRPTRTRRTPLFRGVFAWWVGPADSLRLSFGDGFSGISLTLHTPNPLRDTLRGHIEDHWDSGPPFWKSRGTATAVRIACP